MTREPNSKDVQQDVQDARARVDRTLSEIEENFAPGQLFERAMDYMREHSEGIGDFSRNMGRTLRDHPVPVLLVGAGLAALAFSAMRGRRRGDYYERGGYYLRDSDDEWTEQEWQEGRSWASDEYSSTEFARGDDEATWLYGTPTESRDSGFFGHRTESGGRVREQASAAMEKAKGAGRRASERMASAGREMRQGYSRAGRAIEDTYQQQPLIYGALAMLAGFGLAALLPPTRQEDALMGGYRDDLREQAKDAMSEAAAVARDSLAPESRGHAAQPSAAAAEEWPRQQGDAQGPDHPAPGQPR